MTRYFYFGEEVTLLEHKKEAAFIEYADHFQEWVDFAVLEERKFNDIQKVNPQRRQRNFTKAYGSEKRVAKVKSMPCLLHPNRPAENVHVVSKAAGGTYRDVVNLCRTCHNELHQIGITTFENKYGIDLKEEASVLSEHLGD